MQAMKGATTALGAMNKSMNLPQLQRIAMEFEKENDIMDQRQEMMDDAIDDAMDTGVEEEGDEVVEQVLEEIGVDLSQSVGVPRQSRRCQTLWLTEDFTSLERPPPAYRPAQWQRAGWPRLKRWEAAVVPIRVMTTSRLDWTV